MPEDKPLSYRMTILAVMTGVVFVGVMDSIFRPNSIERKVDQLLKQQSGQMRIENVIGSEAPEKFYEVGDNRAYLEIDGKPIEEYVRER